MRVRSKQANYSNNYDVRNTVNGNVHLEHDAISESKLFRGPPKDNDGNIRSFSAQSKIQNENNSFSTNKKNNLNCQNSKISREPSSKDKSKMTQFKNIDDIPDGMPEDIPYSISKISFSNEDYQGDSNNNRKNNEFYTTKSNYFAEENLRKNENSKVSKQNINVTNYLEENMKEEAQKNIGKVQNSPLRENLFEYIPLSSRSRENKPASSHKDILSDDDEDYSYNNDSIEYHHHTYSTKPKSYSNSNVNIEDSQTPYYQEKNGKISNEKKSSKSDSNIKSNNKNTNNYQDDQWERDVNEARINSKIISYHQPIENQNMKNSVKRQSSLLQVETSSNSKPLNLNVNPTTVKSFVNIAKTTPRGKPPPALPFDLADTDTNETEKNKLFFSREHRNVEYKPYSLEQYRVIRPTEYVEIGNLKPDLNTDVLVAKRANKERIKEFAKKLKEFNHETLLQQQKLPPSSEQLEIEKSKQKVESKREKALQFAKNVPKPKPRVVVNSAIGEKGKVGVDKGNENDETDESLYFDGFESESAEAKKLAYLEAEHDERKKKVEGIRKALGLK